MVHYYTGTQWYTITLVHCSALAHNGTLVHWYTGTPVYKYTGKLVQTVTFVHTVTLLHTGTLIQCTVLHHILHSTQLNSSELKAEHCTWCNAVQEVQSSAKAFELDIKGSSNCVHL